jgi:hypothetical protein
LSVNRALDDLRKGYDRLRGRLDKLCAASRVNQPSERSKSIWNQTYKDKTAEAGVTLLRSLEAAASEAGSLSDKNTRLFADRLALEVDEFRVEMEGDVLSRTPSTDVVGQNVKRLFGILPQRGYVTNYLLVAIDEERFCDALAILKQNRSVFLSALEDIRKLHEMRLLPVEERDRIRRALRQVGMPDVSIRLERADQQRVNEPTECMGNCRQVLDLILKILAEAKGFKAGDKFSANLEALGKSKGFLSQPERRLIEKFYSYLSTAWKAGEVPRPGDADLALKLTYIFIERLLETLSAGAAKANS